MYMKKVILGNGEKYAIPNDYSGRPPGDEPHPYPYDISSRRVATKLANTLVEADELPADAKPNDTIVTALTLHPSFLAKSYYPKALLNDYGLTSIGSKEVFVKPEIAVNKAQKTQSVSSSLYFLSGKKSSFEKLLADIEENNLSEEVSNDIGKIEELRLYSFKEKIKSKEDEQYNTYEVVLHADETEKDKVLNFITFIEKMDGEIDKSKIRFIGGLAFCFVKIDCSKISELAKFVFVRVVRPASKINLFNSFLDIDDVNSDAKKILSGKESIAVSRDEVQNENAQPLVAVFDGGLISSQLSTTYLRYFDLTGSNDGDSKIFTHGELVTSAVMYGTMEELSSDEHEIIPLDHYKVYCEKDDEDIGLVDVLDRICSVLSKRKYKIANISLGPEVPCPDDEPNLWTSTLDKIAADGSVLLIIAAGNTGGMLNDFPEDEDLARIQPPADILNGISIGATDSQTNKWSRANYSSIGPGRRPGYIKPDVVFFGGCNSDQGEKLRLIGLYDFEEKKKYGTSFAAPLVTRLAARLDRMTLGKLPPATLRSLLIHSAESNNDKKGCGWGRVDKNLNNFVFCSDDSVTIIYQGVLNKSSGVRAAIPCPSILQKIKTNVALDATICFYTEVDHQHPVSYSRAGIEVTFRPHSEKFTLDKATGKLSSEAATRTLFSKTKIYGNEQTLRRDAHKWETCYKVNDSFFSTSILEPCLDIRYLTRDEGHALSKKEMRSLPELNYSLVVTLKTKKPTKLYDYIVNEYNLLKPLDINVREEVIV